MDQRKVERTPACDEVSYRVGGNTATGMLRNLSIHGCQIGSERACFAKGDPIVVTLIEGISIDGLVAWMRDGEFGVEFNRAIGEATVRYLGMTLHELPLDGPEHDRFGRPLPPLGTLESPLPGPR